MVHINAGIAGLVGALIGAGAGAATGVAVSKHDTAGALIGCGALGTVIANTLARAGVGHIVIADRDFIELNNLQRQILFDEEDIARGLPKAIAAAEKPDAAAVRNLERQVTARMRAAAESGYRVESLLEEEIVRRHL